ncbi:MAG TPA: alpha/beta hydrolase [Thermoanaerobaculia bacterium]|nr:alpha/beta hydrolase [Thermoanaerobaculia bacterium]
MPQSQLDRQLNRFSRSTSGWLSAAATARRGLNGGWRGRIAVAQVARALCGVLLAAGAAAGAGAEAGAGAAARASAGPAVQTAAAAPTGVEAGTLEVAGGKLYYEVAGHGPALVLVHDGLLHSVTWGEQFEAFARGYRVVRYDRRGYGRSPAATAPYSNVEDLLALFSALAIDRAAVVGCSAGGGLAIDFTLAHPERVRALVLVGAVVGGLPYSDHFLTRGGRLPATPQPQELKSAIEYWAVSDPYYVAADHRQIKERVKALFEANPQNFRHPDRFQQHPPGSPLAQLPAIHAPTLIVVGENDIPDVHAHAGAIQAGIAGAQRIVVRDAGHLVHLEQPQLFNSLVFDFLKAQR